MTADGRSVDVVLVVALGIVLCLPLLARVRGRRFDPFEPIVLFAVAYGVMFVVRPGAMIAQDSFVHEGPRQALDVSATFTEMLLVALAGAVAFVGAYALPLGARLARRHEALEEPSSYRTLATVAVLLGVVGLLAYGAVLASSGFASTLRSILRSGNTELPTGSAANYGAYVFLVLAPVCLVLLALGLERRSAWPIAASAMLGTCFLALMLPIGGRIALLPFVGGLLTFYYLRQSRRPSLAALVVLAVVGLLGSTVLSDLRGRTSRNETVLEAVERATTPSRLTRPVTEGPDAEMAPALAAALGVIPERLPYTYGATVFGDLITRPIPRSLWEGKPQIPRRELLAEIWPTEFERGTINAEFSALVYFFWDFGIVGVVVGLGLYGILFRYAFEYFLRFRATMFAQVLFALLLWFVVIAVRDGPVDTLVRAVFVLGPVWAIFAVARAMPALGGLRSRSPGVAP